MNRHVTLLAGALAAPGMWSLDGRAQQLAIAHRELIIRLAARCQMPAIYPFCYFVIGGGLMSYGPDGVDQYRRGAGYVDRILKGEKPAHLPVEESTRVELVVNLTTARALGLAIPRPCWSERMS